jgi:hypothetical protein
MIGGQAKSGRLPRWVDGIAALEKTRQECTTSSIAAWGVSARFSAIDTGPGAPRTRPDTVGG